MDTSNASRATIIWTITWHHRWIYTKQPHRWIQETKLNWKAPKQMVHSHKAEKHSIYFTNYWFLIPPSIVTLKTATTSQLHANNRKGRHRKKRLAVSSKSRDDPGNNEQTWQKTISKLDPQLRDREITMLIMRSSPRTNWNTRQWSARFEIGTKGLNWQMITFNASMPLAFGL